MTTCTKLTCDDCHYQDVCPIDYDEYYEDPTLLPDSDIEEEDRLFYVYMYRHER